MRLPKKETTRNGIEKKDIRSGNEKENNQENRQPPFGTTAKILCVKPDCFLPPPPPPIFLVSVVYVYLSTDVSLALNAVLTFTQSVQIKNSTWEWVGAH